MLTFLIFLSISILVKVQRIFIIIISMYIPYSQRNIQSSDVYFYDRIPVALRNQIIHILRDSVPKIVQVYAEDDEKFYKMVSRKLAEEHGMKELPSGMYWSNRNDVENYFTELDNIDYCLDVIEIAFYHLVAFAKNKVEEVASNAVKRLNVRFKQHGLGYQLENNVIIKVDSEQVHAEAIKPAIKLLQQNDFNSANDEFMGAFEHYRHGRHKESIAEANKALETTLKTICFQNNWTYDQHRDTASKLFAICFEKGLVPAYMQDHYTGLRKTLEAGVPTIRNKTSGHGQGPKPTDVPEFMVSYVLNLTASAIKFLVESHIEYKHQI
ncbi:hypothetical protein D770_24885 [Flammeovirgaceae bacterium 311]|nr:hypothetical protein D770_24885 [Flammeovirgaceae bacterium 311]